MSALSDSISSGSGSDAPFTTPLPIPPVLTPSSRDANTDYYGVSIRSGSAQMKAGAATAIVGFNGIAPGPTIVATRGRSVQITHTNDWTENVSIHNHGHKVAAASDGHPTDYVKPGLSKTYTYPNDQRAGTYWYHDHTMDLTGPHVYQGLAGFYLIHDPAEDTLNLPSGAYDIPLLIQDKSFNSDNSLVYDPDHMLGFLGDTAVVNGVVAPYLDVTTHKFRFRVLNGSNARPMALQLRVHGSSTAQPFQIIASDGGLLSAPVEVTVLPVAPAERYDIVVDFSKYPVGTQLDLVGTNPVLAFAGAYTGGAYPAGSAAYAPGYGAYGAGYGAYGAGYAGSPWGGPGGPGTAGSPWNGRGGPGGVDSGWANGSAWGGYGPANGTDTEWADGTWGDADGISELTQLMQFVVDRAESDPSSVPSRLANVQRLDPSAAVGTQQIVFRREGEDWTIDGLTYDPTRIDVSSELDQVYIWSISNESAIPHPFHKHLSAFNVLDINGQAPPSFANGWKDTVMVPPFSTVRILFKDETFSGTYVFHCHNLEHEDHGMMLQEGVGLTP